MRLLEYFWSMLALIPEDRARLYERGFDDNFINIRGFKSVHLNNIRAIINTISKFGPAKVGEAGLAIVGGGLPPEPEAQIIRRNYRPEGNYILIPYKNELGQIVKIRAHQLGIKGQPAQIYFTPKAFLRSDICIIAESEFKADAASLFGFASIGIPGINAMSGKNWPYFAEKIAALPCEEFVICFDNEVKDNPSFSNFKQDWRKRYDTIIAAYSLACKIQQLGKKCRIATLPSDWMEDGKVDIDQALAQGRTAAEFAAVIKNAIDPVKFITSAPIKDTHRPYVHKRLGSLFQETEVQIKDNCFYFIPPGDDKRKVERKLANCSWHVKRSYVSLGDEFNEGLRRDITIVDEFGISYDTRGIRAGDMVSKASLAQWLMSHGNFVFYGKDEDVSKIWTYVFMTDDTPPIHLIHEIGYVPKLSAHVFDTMIIRDTGEVFTPNEEGIFYIDDVGYKLAVQLPMNARPKLVKGTPPLAEFKELLRRTVHESTGEGAHLVMISWIYATMFTHVITEHTRIFPLIFFQGLFQSGKTTIMRWLCSLLGLHSEAISIKNSSYVGIARSITEMHNLPIVLDDYRNIKDCLRLIPTFLAVYNRQSGVKGNLDPKVIVRSAINSTLAICGEHVMNDGAAMTRCLHFYIGTRTSDAISEIQKILPQMSSVYYNVLTTNYKENCAKLPALIDKWVAFFKSKTLTPRASYNYGVCFAAYELVETTVPNEMITFALRNATETAQTSSSMDCVHTFGEEFLFGKTQQILIKDNHYKQVGDTVYIWLSGVYSILNKYYNRTDNPMPTTLENIKRANYFIGVTQQSLLVGYPAVPCIIINVAKMPETLRLYFDGNDHDTGRTSKETDHEVLEGV